MAQLVEHIVHIDGVTGSSPVATTREALESQGSRAFISAQCFKSCQKAAVGGLSLSKSPPAAAFSARSLRNVCAQGRKLRPLKNPWFWKEPRFLRPSDARNAHEKCCGIRLWDSAPNPGRGMIPLHPALCQQPVFAPKGANSPPARQSRAIRIHFGGPAGPPNLAQMGYLTG